MRSDPAAAMDAGTNRETVTMTTPSILRRAAATGAMLFAATGAAIAQDAAPVVEAVVEAAALWLSILACIVLFAPISATANAIISAAKATGSA